MLAAVRRGYAVVLQDVRGPLRLRGVFEPYRQEGRDGYDTIEWAARQPWSNGRSGTFGLSYPGAVQWLAAVEQPAVAQGDGAGDDLLDARRTSGTRAACGTGPGSTGPGSTSRPTSAAGSASPDPQTDEEAARRWDAGGSRRAPVPADARAARSFKGVAPWYFEWMRHPPGRSPGGASPGSPARYDRVDAAVLNLSGWFDEMYGPSGAVENFQGAGDALVLGTLDSRRRRPVQRSKAGERDFGTDRGAGLRRRRCWAGWIGT